eukprot:TRINITY_DN4114_c0_g1_i6.p1 TRINITY_DN4114_c0_g1~~TRINITY_DN4114_c0_g1_i6.p1  ORF type:complete len:118 (-),score=28.21 TRINITY_DN4114_c0_g1_i6:1046-1399(-)
MWEEAVVSTQSTGKEKYLQFPMGACFGSTPTDALPDDVPQREPGGHVMSVPDFGTRWKDDIHNICARPISKLPVHIDLPRLCKKIVVTGAGEVHFDGKKPKYNDRSNQDVTKALLCT